MDDNINTPSVLNEITTENTHTENETKLLEIQNIMQQKQQDYNIALTFINSNKKDLANIYLQHTSLLNAETNDNDDNDNDDVDNADNANNLKGVKRVKEI